MTERNFVILTDPIEAEYYNLTQDLKNTKNEFFSDNNKNNNLDDLHYKMFHIMERQNALLKVK